MKVYQPKKKDYDSKCKEKIDSLFYSESLVEFICQSCKSKPSYVVMKNKLEEEIKSLNERLQQNKSECEVNDNSEKAERLQIEIATLKSDIDNKIQQNEQLNTEMNTALVLLQSKFESFKSDFSSDLANTLCIVNTNNTNNDQTKSNVNVNDTENVSKCVNNNYRKSVTLSPFASPFENPIDTQPMSGEINQNHGLFEIYIAKFKTNVKCEQISNHIIDSTNINDSDSFYVQMLGGNLDDHSYASFKITTLKYEVCNAILNMNWNPQSASIFTRKSSKRTNVRSRFNGNDFDNRYKTINNFSNNRSIENRMPRNRLPKKYTQNRMNYGEVDNHQSRNMGNNRYDDDTNTQWRPKQNFNNHTNDYPYENAQSNHRQNQSNNNKHQNRHEMINNNEYNNHSRGQNYNGYPP